MEEKLKPNGTLVSIDNHNLHVYTSGDKNKPKLVFMSGACVPAPVYEYKILYGRLAEKYRVIVIEKFGYGYSDLFEAPCDIDYSVTYQKTALEKLTEKGPYILVPHSMSGLEAIRWKQKYSEDVAAIIGLDMATPASYFDIGERDLGNRIKGLKILQKIKKAGLLNRILLTKRGLTKEEAAQQKLLWRRNGLNNCIINEGEAIFENAKNVEASGKIACPVLLFVSNGRQCSQHWVEIQRQFAEEMKAEINFLKCGHCIYYFESEFISREIEKFVERLH